MGKKIKEVDAYFAKSADFAKPILKHLRELIHKACPDVEEKIKWGMPCFDYKGPIIGLASFKAHVALGFWKASIMKDKDVLLKKENKGTMGNLGKISSLKELPKDSTIIKWVKEAAKLNEDGVKVDKKTKSKPELTAPPYMMKAINGDKKAKETWAKFAPSHKREYTEWITEAKTEETREKRMATMLEWLAEGKQKHWKYQKK